MSLFGKKESDEATGGEAKARGKTGKRSYGIAETTMLMRTLPVDQNVELVVRVVRHTLESMNVQLSEIIEDAVEKETSLQSRMQVLSGEIAELSKQIDGRKQEIARLEEELHETTTVKDRLLLAQKLGGKPAAGRESASPPPVPLRVAKPAIEARQAG
jgi:hypothetical protein